MWGSVDPPDPYSGSLEGGILQEEDASQGWVRDVMDRVKLYSSV